MTWKRGNSLNGSINFEPIVKLETPPELKQARYERKRGHLPPGPSFNFATSRFPYVLISGWCCANSTAHDACTLVRHDAARCWVHWADGTYPPGVHYGAHVYVIGNLRTFNVGGGFHIAEACLLEVSPQAMIAAALEAYPDAVIPPRGKEIRQRKPRKVEPDVEP